MKIILERKSYGNTKVVYYCSERVYTLMKGNVPLNMCGFYIVGGV